MEDIHILSEEDIKLRYITPAILAKDWSVNDITMETQVKLTDGKINLRGNLVARGKAKYADYVLYYNRATPIAIVEAKDANHSVSHGIQQAKEYASMMDIPFAFSSNGFGFQEYDFLTGKERSFSMDEFPTMEELYQRYLSESNNGNGLSERN
jgi:type I restriction enzyme R subunit